MSTALEAVSGSGAVGQPAPPAGATAAAGRSRQPPPAILRSGWVPVVVVTVLTALVLRFYGVPLATTGIFAAYVLLGIVLPGTLIWRACHRRAGWLVGDVAGGTVVGYVLEVLTYIGARALGVPLLVLAWPVLTYGAFLAVPALRRFWRGSGAGHDRIPWWWAWSLSAIVAVIVVRSTKFFRWHLLEWPYAASSDADSPFHLALVGEAKHHMPMMAPWVSGERLVYHWFVYPEMAATSWVTGIEPLVLLFRLSVLPMLVAFVVLIAVMARRLNAAWWTGPVAAVATFFVVAPNPYSWPVSDGGFGFGTVEDGSVFRLVAWTSPTQTFGALIFAAIMLLLIDLLDGGPRAVGRWALLILLLAGLSGAKSPYLPLLSAALLLVVAVSTVVRRRLPRPALLAAAIVVGFTVLAQLVLYGGATQGLRLSPLAATRWFGSAAAATIGFTDAAAPMWRLLVVAGLTVLTWIFIWAGVAGLVVRGRVTDPVIVLLLGFGAVGMAGYLLLGHAGGAEGYLMVSARPYLALAAVVGLAAAIGTRAASWRVGTAMFAACMVGAAAVWLVRLIGDPGVPHRERSAGYSSLAWALSWPFLLLLGMAVTVGVGLYLARRRLAAVRGLGLGLLVCLCAGFGLPSTTGFLAEMVGDSSANGWRKVADASLVGTPDGLINSIMTGDTAMAGRWLRDHSAADDLVATNAHCLGAQVTPDPCDNRHFSISALAERRVLVEGWGFTNSSYLRAARANVPPWFVDFWDPDRLAANDAAFHTPSAEAIGRLRDQYGVRWLFVDVTHGAAGDALERYAKLRFRAGTCAVYEVDR